MTSTTSDDAGRAGNSSSIAGATATETETEMETETETTSTSTSTSVGTKGDNGAIVERDDDVAVAAFAAAIVTTAKTTNVVNGSRANGDIDYRDEYDGGCDEDGRSTGGMLDLLGSSSTVDLNAHLTVEELLGAPRVECIALEAGGGGEGGESTRKLSSYAAKATAMSALASSALA